MDRLEQIRVKADQMIEQLAQEGERKFAYIHLYGVSQFAALLAMIHHIDAELCQIAAMLHDIAVYAYNVAQKDHAQKSAELAQAILEESAIFTKKEIQTITHAIAVHSDKQVREDNVYAEVLKDADVLAHYLYNPNIPMSEHDQVRLYYLMEALSKYPLNQQGKA